ncbi:hypothetical protein FO440_14385 [Mucilaginibacter corticis]|uniref:DUF3276 family protein n=1 Tax=Mucilaginibacter corticis TaxID=2597670 RepID=A0A556MLX0_9SPHI|nr:hypothetical protein [Mucilaginibacter corticis]TSJ40921.1 hypothetical protein FO440_14385 [Mucilaginibacter corticis]
MEKHKTKLTGIIDSEYFFNQNRQFYLDIKQAKNKNHYLRITRRDQAKDESFTRYEIIFLEDDLQFLVEAMSMLLGRYSSGQLGISA